MYYVYTVYVLYVYISFPWKGELWGYVPLKKLQAFWFKGVLQPGRLGHQDLSLPHKGHSHLHVSSFIDTSLVSRTSAITPRELFPDCIFLCNGGYTDL